MICTISMVPKSNYGNNASDFLLLFNQCNDIKHLFKLVFFKRSINPYFLINTPEGINETHLSSCPSFIQSQPPTTQTSSENVSLCHINIFHVDKGSSRNLHKDSLSKQSQVKHDRSRWMGNAAIIQGQFQGCVQHY